MPTHPHLTDEESALGSNGNIQGNSDLLNEFKHTKAGPWDVYEHIPHNRFKTGIHWVSKLSPNTEIIEDLPFVWRMLNNVAKTKAYRFHLCLLLLVRLLASLEPVLALWFTSHYLTLIQVAVGERRFDEKLLIFASTGRVYCKIAEIFLRYWEKRLKFPLSVLMKEHSDKGMFDAMANLDLPTFNDQAVGGRMDMDWSASSSGVIWDSLWVAQSLFFSTVRLVAELAVLMKAIGSQRGGTTFTILHLGQKIYEFLNADDHPYSHMMGIVAVTRNEHYVKLPGLEAMVKDAKHRQELVAGNCSEFLKVVYNRAYAHVSGERAELQDILGRTRIPDIGDILSAVIPGSIEGAAEVAYLLNSARHPENIPICLATIGLIRAMSQNFFKEFWDISQGAGSIRWQFKRLRDFYEIHETRNKIPDGTVPFPEDIQSLASGIAVEFRNVSFRYPGKDDFALQNVSFKIGKGQLCVIVGTNGSGKSTLLKLMLRLYDPTEGTILVNGQDIRTLKLAGLRESMAVLFQDYAYPLLSIKDNIGLGDPRNAHDETKIREAARLGGAEEFINKIAGGFDAYLDRPFSDYWGIPDGTRTKSGVEINPCLFEKAFGRIEVDNTTKLSGGQMQRLAVSRSFMRSVVSGETRVGLLLFDEPSAALDPIAEHDLFTKLGKLRGEKTMIFSSHRFGQLTKPADIILCMDNTRVMESGTHAELMAKEGKYAQMWNLQVGGFL